MLLQRHGNEFGIGFSATIMALVACCAPVDARTDHVQSDTEVSVRSGPGEKFYATGYLPPGAKVDVVHELGDWLAIRPPEGSFSWLPVADLEAGDAPRTARVRREQSRTRVGTDLSNDRNVAAVTLKRGDTVQLLEPLRRHRLNSTQSRWIRIACPSGEYRYVHRKDVGSTTDSIRPDKSNADEPLADAKSAEWSKRSGAETATTTSPVATRALPEPPAIQADERTDDVQLAQWSYDLAPRTYTDAPMLRDGNELPEQPSLSQALKSIRQALEATLPPKTPEAGTTPTITPQPTNLANEPQGPEAPIVALTSGQEPLALEPPPSYPTQPAEGLSSSGGGDPTSAAPLLLSTELAAVAAELGQTVSQDPGSWVLPPLRNRVQAVIDAGKDATVRDRGLQMLARIAQFEDLQRRFRQLRAGSLTAPTGPSTGMLANRLGNSNGGASNSAGPASAVPPIDVTQYDGYGWLMPVLAQNRRLPRYVLTDNQGNIMQFVTPSPGLNLNRFENKRVGIYGQRNFLPQMKQPHLVAERIVTIDKVR